MKCETALLQDIRELDVFIELLKLEDVISYLEIGSKHGGSLWRIARGLPKGSRIVSVDLPQGDGSFKESQKALEECAEALNKLGYPTFLLLGDSTDPNLVADVAKLGPFDACMIDANHTEPYIRMDWANYGPMARIVAFHDISYKPKPTKKQQIEVPEVWNDIKAGFRHKEIKFCERSNGIGIIWRD